MVHLPEEYCKNMRQMLGEEYPAYEQSFQQDAYTALRINTSKITLGQWNELCPFQVARVPWNEKGFYFDSTIDQPAKHPYYFAGLYYIQEPSAMIPASLLPVQAGDHILDLCAAPGGKATELAAKLDGTGLLVANDISVSRAMALAKNLQVAGAVNAVVTAEKPENLARHFPEYFDGILIDAPCSGEGMFRRDPHMIRDWMERGPEYYEKIQKEILQESYSMLRPGGHLVYSTCTFSEKEDEELIRWFLSKYPDMRICPVERKSGFEPGRGDHSDSPELTRCVRIFPHKTKGEGHFAVLLQREGAAEKKAFSVPKAKGKRQRVSAKPAQNLEAKKWAERFELPEGDFQIQKDHVILVPKEMKGIKGLRMIQSGLILGTQKKRFEPSVQLALTAAKRRVPCLSLTQEDIRVIKYLKGETISVDGFSDEDMLQECDGYVLVCVNGFALGWAKYSGNGMLKNKYYAGWRLQ